MAKGLRFTARLVAVGPVPPCSGPARTAFLLERGREAGRSAMKSYLFALDAVEGVIGPTPLPYSQDPFAPPDDDDVTRRLGRWEAIRTRLVAAAPDATHLPGEDEARAALAYGVDSFRDLTGTEREDAVHRRMHRYAEFVCGIYYCKQRWDAVYRAWFDTCALAHAHNPIGVSIGFTATWLCSICRQDISDCDHDSLTVYEIVAERYDDSGRRKCSVCHETACDHKTGRTYQVRQSRVMTNPVMHEATITPTPREPRARLAETELEGLRPPGNGRGRRCLTCLSTCGEVMALPPHYSE